MSGRHLFFLSDFGLGDPYVGLMKARALAEGFGGTMVDLSHGIPPGDVPRGVAMLEDCLPWLPAGAVVCAVVDPGVGGARAALAARAGGMAFVGPDNGLLTPVLRQADCTVRAIDPERLGLPMPSATFHGRDVFAPIAARIAAGLLSVDDTGPAPSSEPVLLDLPLPVPCEGGGLELTVLYVDGFGNAALNLRSDALPRNAGVEFHLGGRPLGSLQRTYGDVAPGQPLVYVNSFGRIEVAVRGGSAARELPLPPGATIVMKTAGTGE